MKSANFFLSLFMCSMTAITPINLLQCNEQISKEQWDKTLEAVLPHNEEIRSLTDGLISEWCCYKIKEDPNFDINRLVAAIIYGAKKHEGKNVKTLQQLPISIIL